MLVEVRVYHHTVDVLRRTFQNDVANISAYDIALQPQRICRFADAVQERIVDGSKRVGLS
jgi:hypothetical protein